MVEILPAWENTKPVFHICMNLNQPLQASFCLLSVGFLFFKNAGAYMDLYCLQKENSTEKRAFGKL